MLIASEHHSLATIQSILKLQEPLENQLTQSEQSATIHLQSKHYNLLVCTQSLNSGNGASLTKKARSKHPNLVIIFLVTKRIELLITRQVNNFCNAIIADWDLDHPEQPLSSAIRATAENDTTYHSPSIRTYIQESEALTVEELTPREKTVLELILMGMSNKEIASRLLLSPSTVKSYGRDVIRKLGVKNRQQAILLAIEIGLLEQHP